MTIPGRDGQTDRRMEGHLEISQVIQTEYFSLKPLLIHYVGNRSYNFIHFYRKLGERLLLKLSHDTATIRLEIGVLLATV